MYKLIFTKTFKRSYKRISRTNKQLETKIQVVLYKLSREPGDPVLNSHKVRTRRFGLRWSSSVTGDIRIIWDYSREKLKIILLTIGGHSGRQKVYK